MSDFSVDVVVRHLEHASTPASISQALLRRELAMGGGGFAPMLSTVIFTMQLTYYPHDHDIHTKVTALEKIDPIPTPKWFHTLDRPLASRVCYRNCLSDHGRPINLGYATSKTI